MHLFIKFLENFDFKLIQMAKCCFHSQSQSLSPSLPLCPFYSCSKRLDAELIRRGHDIRHNRYPIGYQEAPLAYDAVWSVALAFNRTMERLARKDKKRSLKDFTYTDGDIAGEIYAAMNSTSFLGVSVSSNIRNSSSSSNRRRLLPLA